ncbi:MAG: hypothetical protein GXN99_00525 [Candidatus Nanohaloarchaeota archaeon]|nr:hypothetical protein [Candidatus Nanohaloarchaeota archaeon]
MLTQEILFYVLGIILFLYIGAVLINYYIAKHKDKMVDVSTYIHVIFIVVITIVLFLLLFLSYFPQKTTFLYSFIFSLVIGSIFYLYHHYKREGSKSYVDKFYAPRIPFILKKKKKQNHS